MRSSASTQHISKPFIVDQQQTHPHPQPSNYDDDDETSTYSFRHVTKKLQHAKSHGELYQPRPPLPLPPMTRTNNDENEIKYRVKHSSTSSPTVAPTRARSATAVDPILTRPTINASDETFSSHSANKIPLWKRFKRMIVPTKRNKAQQNPLLTVPPLQLSESSTNERSKPFHLAAINASFSYI
jgi:hypothetical protein